MASVHISLLSTYSPSLFNSVHSQTGALLTHRCLLGHKFAVTSTCMEKEIFGSLGSTCTKLLCVFLNFCFIFSHSPCPVVVELQLSKNFALGHGMKSTLLLNLESPSFARFRS